MKIPPSPSLSLFVPPPLQLVPAAQNVMGCYCTQLAITNGSVCVQSRFIGYRWFRFVYVPNTLSPFFHSCFQLYTLWLCLLFYTYVCISLRSFILYTIRGIDISRWPSARRDSPTHSYLPVLKRIYMYIYDVATILFTTPLQAFEIFIYIIYW